MKSHLYVTGSSFHDSKFLLEQIHFHWGSSNGQGSEHTVNKKRRDRIQQKLEKSTYNYCTYLFRFPMEMHMVHRNSKYKGLREALGHSDGLAVFAVFFELDNEEEDHKWEKGFRSVPRMNADLVRKLWDVLGKGQEVEFSGINIGGMADLGFAQYFHYPGSLTTPPCREGVRWFISTVTSRITKQQEIIEHLLQGVEKTRVSFTAFHVQEGLW